MVQAWEGKLDINSVVNGSGALIGHKKGSLSSAAATFSGATSGYITPADGNVSIPAYYLTPLYSKLAISGLVRRRGANATAVLNVRLGKNNTTTDNVVSTQTMAASGDLDVRFNSEVNILSQTAFNTTGTLSTSTPAVSGLVEKTTQFDTYLANYVSVDVSSANASDAFDLIDLQVIHWK